ncbi:PREDICTED: NFAT activation molecule 1 isoform X2 [Condylura cristata]|uniref:NFAT activation molecule 1 isoform X2 n=1 Tax=Condylura cristata TaxID=143302 RepID=UPI000642C268|nr:PREDICTED: NFAT activation molecule 1 isoform X2 [Condylura cristata]
MDGRARRWWALPGLSPAPLLLACLLLAWPRVPAGQSVSQPGSPILVSLANGAVSFNCSITYLYTPKFKSFDVSYFYMDTQGRPSKEQTVPCPPSSGTENQTHTVVCQITAGLARASATGTYYCVAHWGRIVVRGPGTFILVRDVGYQEPPLGSRKFLLLFFLGLLSVLSLLGTALLLRKKARTPGKHLAWKCPATSPAKGPQQLTPDSDSVYTALQRRDTEVYSCIQSEASSPSPLQTPHSQEKLRRFEDDGEFNLVYENL